MEVIVCKDSYDFYEVRDFVIGGMVCRRNIFNENMLIFDTGTIDENGIYFRGYWRDYVMNKNAFCKLKSVMDFFIKGWNFTILMQRIDFYIYKDKDAIYTFHIARLIYWSSRNKDGALSHFPKEIVKMILEKYLDCPHFEPRYHNITVSVP